MIKNVKLQPLKDPRFIQPALMHYEEGGVAKTWELVKAHDSVAILLYNRDREALVLVRQFRPAVYLANNDGYSYELCAGIVDKEKSLPEIAAEEISEETGYQVPPDRLQRVSSFYTSVGFAGNQQVLYFATVGDTDRKGQGGGIGIEQIEVIHLPLADAKPFVFDESRVKTPGLMFGFYWFFEHQEDLTKSPDGSILGKRG
jgi:UDP-sugar diphosphatase